jgi:alkylation response protein AidB-like acyl-CoA dehydrogenase
VTVTRDKPQQGAAIASRHRSEIDLAAEALVRALASKDLSEFYRVFRNTSLPFLGAEYLDDAGGLFAVCFEIVHRLGAISPAVALAVENHFYVTSAMATFPTNGNAQLHRRRRELLAHIFNDRRLVANTNSKVHTASLGQIGTLAKREGEGFRINGTASYTSLATEADLLVLLTELEGEGSALFAITPMQGNPAVEIGPYLFPNAMIDSDTRRITFHDLALASEALVVAGDNELQALLFPFEMAWHQLLIAALYLGAAAGAIEDARAFLTSTCGRDGRPLAELDGMITTLGQLALQYSSARCVVDKAGDALADIEQLPLDAPLVDRAVNLASVAKYTGTCAAEAIVTTARRIVGARAFSGGWALERLSQEVIFASLGPEVTAVIERRYGKLTLQAESVSDLPQ